METKLPKPDWRMLQRRIESVEVVSCADGSMRIKPKWRLSWTKNPNGPGIFTRIGAADEMERLINRGLRVKQLPDSADDAPRT